MLAVLALRRARPLSIFLEGSREVSTTFANPTWCRSRAHRASRFCVVLVCLRVWPVLAG